MAPARAGLRKTILRNTAISSGERAAEVLVRLLVLPLIVHGLGREAYGIYVLVMMFSFSGLLSFLDLGVRTAAVKYTAEYASRRDTPKVRSIFWTTFVFCQATGLLAVFLLGFMGLDLLPGASGIPGALRGPTQTLMVCMGLEAWALFGASSFEALLEGHQRYDLSRGARAVHTLLWGMLLATVLLQGGGLAEVGKSLVVVSFVYLGLLAFLAGGLLPKVLKPTGIRWRWAAGKIGQLSVWLLLSRLNQLVISLSPRWIGATFLPLRVLGFYDIVAKPFYLIHTAVGTLNAAVTPAASSLEALEAQAGGKLRRLFLKGTQGVLAVLLPPALAVLVFLPDFLGLWMGPDYRRFAGPARLVLIQSFPLMLTITGVSILVGLNRLRAAVLWVSLAACLQVLGGLVAVPRWGLWGMAGTSIMAWILAAGPLMSYCAKALGAHVWRDLPRAWGRTLLLAAGLGLGAWIFRGVLGADSLGWLGLLCGGGAVTVSGWGLWVLWVAEPADRSWLREWFGHA